MDANVYEGASGAGRRFGIVRARFNQDVTGGLLAACTRVLREAGVREEDIDVVEVPGCVEIPYALGELAAEGGFDALIALGAVIKGATPHFEFISSSVTDGLRDLSLQRRVPVIAGIVTALTRAQAEERAGDGPLNRGAEAAHVALEMAELREKRGWCAT